MDCEERENGECVLHVLDLPQIYNKPSANELIETLTMLTSEPPSWEGSDSEDEEKARTTSRRQSFSAAKARPLQINPEGLTAYLTRIISSPLAWIPEDSVKEEIWEAASVRLSERSGRTAMPAMSRSFRIPLSKTTSVKIQIHEPSLTADNLGLKTWASSYLLAKRLHLLVEDDVALPLHGGAENQQERGCSVLELGSGTGLVGIAAAAVFGTEVHLTDLPEIIENLDRNAVTNGTLIRNRGGQARTAMLDWTNPAVMEPPLQQDSQDTLQARYELVLAADPLYSPEHPQLLVSAIKAQLVDDAAARVVIELPLRTAYQSTVEEFLDRMEGLGLCIVREGYETGYDDWGELGGRRDVRCWWSVWGWKAYVGCGARGDEDVRELLVEEFGRLDQTLM